MDPEHHHQQILAADDHAMTIAIHSTAPAVKVNRTDVHRATREEAEMILAVPNSMTVEIEMTLLSVNNTVDVAMMGISREIEIVMTDAVSPIDSVPDTILRNKTNGIAAVIARMSLGEVGEKVSSQIEANLDVTHQTDIAR